MRAKDLLSEEQIATVEHRMHVIPWRADGPPFPPYAFSNTAGEIGRIKKRIAELQQGPPELDPIEGDGWRIEARPDLNRVAITFDAKPPAEIITKLKRGGWRWSPREGAWLRLFNKATLWAVDDAVKFLPASQPNDDEPSTVRESRPIYRETRPTPPRAAKRASKPARASKQKSAPGKRAKSASTNTKSAAQPKRTSSKPKPKSRAPKKASRKNASRTKKSARHADGPAFARYFRHPVTHRVMDARDYGYKAWPLGSGG